MRALVVQDGRWTVVDQFNPETADAEIGGVATLPRAGERPTIAMYDRKARELLVLQPREEGPYNVVHTMPVGNYDLSAMSAFSFGADHQPALIMADKDRLAVLAPNEAPNTFVAEQSYESDVKDAWLADAVVGDLNHDGVRGRDRRRYAQGEPRNSHHAAQRRVRAGAALSGVSGQTLFRCA